MTNFKSILCVVVFGVIISVPTGAALPTTVQKSQGTNGIFLINITDVYSYTYSCSIDQLVALSADQKSLLFYDIEKPELPTPTSVNLPLPGELFALSVDGKRVVVTHDSYVSVVLNHGHMHSIKTYPISVVQASSVMIIEELVCLVPAFDQWMYIQCLNMDNGATCTCNNDIYAGGLGFVDTTKNWVYVIDQGLDPQSMHKYNVSSARQSTGAKTRCLEYLHDNPDFGTYDYGQRLWFSYDGSQIFLENGLTLTASNDNLDMKPGGNFNSSYETYQYSYFSQSYKNPNVIAGIRSDANNTIYYYTWPYLSPITSKTTVIPAPPHGKANGAQEVHICDDLDITYAVVKYTFSDGTTKIGVIGL